MTLLITEADVRSLLTMPIALEIVEESLRKQGNGELILNPRRRSRCPTTRSCTTWQRPIRSGDTSA